MADERGEEAAAVAGISDKADGPNPTQSYPDPTQPNPLPIIQFPIWDPLETLAHKLIG